MSLLHAIITDDNAERLITEAAGKSRRQIEEMRVRERPKEDISTGVKRQLALDCEPQPANVDSTPVATSTPGSLQESKSVESAKAFRIEARSPGRSVYRTMISDATRDGYERIKDLSGDNDEQIFEDMVKVYEAELLKRKHAQVKRPRKVASTAPDRFVEAPAETLKTIGERYIPAHVKRAVWLRDNGQCQHEGCDGHICGSRRDKLRTGAEPSNQVRETRAHYATSGSVTVNVLPWPTALSRVTVPPWSSTSLRTTARPRPVPPTARVWLPSTWRKASKTSA